MKVCAKKVPHPVKNSGQNSGQNINVPGMGFSYKNAGAILTGKAPAYFDMIVK